MASSAVEITNHQGKLLVTCWMLNSCKINFYLSYLNKKDKSALEHSPFLCISSSASPSQSLCSGMCQNSNFSPCKIVNRRGLVIGKPTEVSNEKKTARGLLTGSKEIMLIFLQIEMFKIC